MFAIVVTIDTIAPMVTEEPLAECREFSEADEYQVGFDLLKRVDDAYREVHTCAIQSLGLIAKPADTIVILVDVGWGALQKSQGFAALVQRRCGRNGRGTATH